MESINYYLFLAAMENRDGAWNLASGNVADALEIFQNAVSILDQLQRLPEISKSDLRKPHFCVSVEVPFLTDEHQRYFAYRRALIFSPLIAESCCIQEIAFYRATALFNMALAYQMKGKALRKPKSHERAIRLFDSCLKAVASIRNGCPDTVLLRVAALNNKAVILGEMLDFERAKLALDEVRGKWLHALVLQYATGAFAKEDVEGFILNTMEAMPPTAAACA